MQLIISCKQVYNYCHYLINTNASRGISQTIEKQTAATKYISISSSYYALRLSHPCKIHVRIELVQSFEGLFFKWPLRI